MWHGGITVSRFRYLSTATVNVNVLTADDCDYSHLLVEDDGEGKEKSKSSSPRRQTRTIRLSIIVAIIVLTLIRWRNWRLIDFVSLFVPQQQKLFLPQPQQQKQILVDGWQQRYKDRIKGISVVVMNHRRPQLLLLHSDKLLSTLLYHPMVKEIIICHSNPITAFNNTHVIEMHRLLNPSKDKRENKYRLLHPNSSIDVTELNTMSNDGQDRYTANTTSFEQLVQLKMKHINATDENDRYGLALRFYFCSNRTQLGASNDWVIHVDDDMDINSVAIDQLILNMALNPRRIVGYFGRNYAFGYRVAYSGLRDVTAEVVLTKLMIIERALCTEFFNYKHLIEYDPPTIPSYRPIKWNGEDIFINLVANRYYNVPPNGPFQNYVIQLNTNRSNEWTGAYAGEIDESNDYISMTASLITTYKETYPYLHSFVTHQQFYQHPQGMSTHSTSSVSGNLEKLKFNSLLGFMAAYVPAVMKSTLHKRYRSKLWYVAKQRLMKHFTSTST
jgi:Glycosyl transferase family 64 domain